MVLRSFSRIVVILGIAGPDETKNRAGSSAPPGFRSAVAAPSFEKISRVCQGNLRQGSRRCQAQADCLANYRLCLAPDNRSGPSLNHKEFTKNFSNQTAAISRFCFRRVSNWAEHFLSRAVLRLFRESQLQDQTSGKKRKEGQCIHSFSAQTQRR
jgi:hypothetical protein